MRAFFVVGVAVAACFVIGAVVIPNPVALASKAQVRSVELGPRRKVLQASDADDRLTRWFENTLGADGRWWADGLRLTFHGNGSLKCEDYFVLGRRHGPCRTYDRDGRLLNEREFVENRPAGLEKQYSPDGILVRVRRYVNGREACAPLERGPGDPPITDVQIACLLSEPITAR